MEEPRNGRLNSTNNQPADPDLPSYRESVEGAGNVNVMIIVWQLNVLAIMLETFYTRQISSIDVGNYKMLVTVLVIFVTSIHYFLH